MYKINKINISVLEYCTHITWASTSILSVNILLQNNIFSINELCGIVYCQMQLFKLIKLYTFCNIPFFHISYIMKDTVYLQAVEKALVLPHQI